jgi:presenilin-like A22 family membrane protease
MVVTLLFYGKFEPKMRHFLGGRELRLSQAVLMVLAIGVMVTAFALIPRLDIIKVFFLAVYSMVLFMFTYTVVPKWYLSILSSIVFIFLYIFYWNVYFLNFFAVIFVIYVSTYLAVLFTWKTVTGFAILLTLMDVIHVFGTQFMVTSSNNLMTLNLPAMIVLPIIPYGFPEVLVYLGLGDVFLAGLLVTQTTRKFGRKTGYFTTAIMAIVFMVFETFLLNFFPGYFPATVMVVSGWLIAIGLRYLYNS